MADRDILPFWIADMDFASPDFVFQTLYSSGFEHPILGYSLHARFAHSRRSKAGLHHHFDWQVPEEWIVWLPGVVPGLNMAAHTLNCDSEHYDSQRRSTTRF